MYNILMKCNLTGKEYLFTQYSVKDLSSLLFSGASIVLIVKLNSYKRIINL